MYGLLNGCRIEQLCYYKIKRGKMKIIIGCILFQFTFFNAQAQQKLFTKNGVVVFFSKASIENIGAKNNKLLSVWDVATGQIEFSVLMKGFQFEKALMQEHFNENYVESDEYPKATFKGVIQSPKNISLDADENYAVNVNGLLTLHGITKQIDISAAIVVKNKAVSATASFTIELADYKIKIPAIVANNISKYILINVTIPSYQPMAGH